MFCLRVRSDSPLEITPELVIERVRAAGGRLRLDDLDEGELAAWRHASKVAYLRLLRVGHERLRRSSAPGSLHLFLERVDEEPPEPDPGLSASATSKSVSTVRQPPIKLYGRSSSSCTLRTASCSSTART